jgi:riboflavin transporter FmnP
MNVRAIKLVASASCLASLAALLAALPLSFPYPVIPYLRFDLAEIPVFLALLLLGPWAGMLSSIAYWLILLLVGSFSPLGPAMKFAAVLSTLIGLWAGFRIRASPRTGLLIGGVLGCAIRVAVMSVFNYNVSTPVSIYPDHIHYFDLELDVVVKPGSGPEIIDADGLEKAVQENRISEELKKTAFRIPELTRFNPPTRPY